MFALLRGVAAVLIVGLFGWQAFAAGGGERIAASEKLGVAVFAPADGSDWCKSSLVLKVVAKEIGFFQGTGMESLMPILRTSVLPGARCLAVSSMSFEGVVGDEEFAIPVYRAQASQEQNWTLVVTKSAPVPKATEEEIAVASPPKVETVPPPAPKPSAINVDSLPASVSAASTSSTEAGPGGSSHGGLMGMFVAIGGLVLAGGAFVMLRPRLPQRYLLMVVAAIVIGGTGAGAALWRSTPPTSQPPPVQEQPAAVATAAKTETLPLVAAPAVVTPEVSPQVVIAAPTPVNLVALEKVVVPDVVPEGMRELQTKEGCRVAEYPAYYSPQEAKDIREITWNGPCSGPRRMVSGTGILHYRTENGQMSYDGDMVDGMRDGIGTFTLTGQFSAMARWAKGRVSSKVALDAGGTKLTCVADGQTQNLVDCYGAGERFGTGGGKALAEKMDRYVKNVVDQTKKNWQDYVETERNAPAACKERRSQCESQCGSIDGCTTKCYEAFLYCAKQ
ncbi:hypothetical protein [Paramagnetospirillum magneticum]|nr:hypothetical protein [Paramagnetospirillum magneticum]